MIQVTGTKRFLLWPPSEADNLYLYPFIHPRALSSQVSFRESPAANLNTTVTAAAVAASAVAQQKAFPRYRRARAVVAELKPGDVLYVPPLWFHLPTATSASMSVSIWTLYKGDMMYHVCTKRVLLPLSLLVCRCYCTYSHENR